MELMKEKLELRFRELGKILYSERNADGFWTGQLSSSALGGAVALAALHFHNPIENREAISKALQWLCSNINSDGSYGDTPKSPGNISTSLLVYAALNLYAEKDAEVKTTQTKIADYLNAQSIDVTSAQVAQAILAHYQKDYTFSVPILTLCALCGIPNKNAFKAIPQLPFELALLPGKFYRLLNLGVVSYAIPALIAVGIVIFKNKKNNKLSTAIRQKAIPKALKKLEKSMPESGGFLEAIPLTAFVSLSLINAGFADSKVVHEGIHFLKRTQREDGSWPIDVDLSTWVSTLSVKALGERKNEILSADEQQQISRHLLKIQNKSIHPFNETSPGGWGWTNFSGSVPDGDDTPGAMLALLQLNNPGHIKTEMLAAAKWLLRLQNSDGGFPTFSKGWGKLPFDQSCADLTGHAFLALSAVLFHYKNQLSTKEGKSLQNSLKRALLFLQKHQKENGSWLPLWFGNQHTEKHENPVYGTARILSYLQDAQKLIAKESTLQSSLSVLIENGTRFLCTNQNSDGSWGGALNIKGSIEETALAVATLAETSHKNEAIRGLEWLDKYFSEHGLKAAPIGLYFASLWYDEKMYPLTAYLDALVRTLKVL